MSIRLGGKYLPRRVRAGTALCLSGGGYRAALLHLGAATRLNELGVLSNVTALSSVSGGSIFSAHLIAHLRPWPSPGEIVDAARWETQVAGPFRRFSSTDIRTWPVLNRLLPWNWLRTTTGVETLARTYERQISPMLLADLPAAPECIYSATDMAFGANWIFTRKRIGDYQAGYCAPPAGWTLGRTVAASSCFPPIFNPLKPRIDPAILKKGKQPAGPRRDACIRGLRLTDGGNYDNMGLEPVWKRAETLLVSDGGAPFTFQGDRWLLSRLSRYTQIQGAQSQALRKRWLMSNFTEGVLAGTYWGVGSCVANYDRARASDGYSQDVVDAVIADVRTDMDGFSEAEIKVLVNHGYSLADAAVRTHAPNVIARNARPFAVPHPEWMNEAAVILALSQSHRRFLRGFFRWWKG